MEKSFSVFIGLLFTIYSHCQGQESNSAVQSAERGDIQAMNLSERLNFINNNIIKYKDQPLYQLKVASPLHYEIRINDIPVYSKFIESKGLIYIPINTAILGSGNQELSIKIVPPSDDPQALIPKDNYFMLELYQTDWEDGSLTEPKTMLSYKLDWEKQDYANLTQVMEEKTFMAKVPYTLTRWRKGKDLRKLDQKELKLIVLEFYKKMRTLRGNRQNNLYKTYFLNADIDWYQSEYFDAKTITNLQTALEKNKDIEKIELLPFENYEMKFAADGRVVYLVYKSGKYKGKFLLSYSSENEDRISVVHVDLFLSIPEGSDQLEII